MSLRCLSFGVVFAFSIAAGTAEARELRVCAEPSNLPFSNDREEGFENRIVRLVADELGAEPIYTWRALRRGFLRETLKASVCDLVPGLPRNIEGVRTTRPYYSSAYVFVSRWDGPSAASLDDPVLREALLGVQLVGDDGANSPPAHALARRGITANVRGYTVYGDYRKPNPPAAIVSAVASGEIDIGLAWGPLAGYFGAKSMPPLRTSLIKPLLDGPQPMVWDISMAVRKGDRALGDAIDAALARRKAEIDAILAEYHVSRLDLPPPAKGADQ